MSSYDFGVAPTRGEEIIDPRVRDRIMKSLHHQEGDKVAIWDSIYNKAVNDHFAPGETDAYQAAAKVFQALDIDMCWRVDDPSRLPWEGTTPEPDEKPLKTVEDLRKIEIPPASEEDIREGVADFMRLQELFAPHTMLVPGGWCGFHYAYDYIGLESFSMAIHDAPSELDRIIGQFVDNAYLRTKVFAEKRLCPLYFIPDDVAYKGKLLFSPSFLRRTLIPALRRVMQPLKEAGIKVIFHSDGYVMPIVEDLISAGIDGLHPLEPLAGMDIGLLKRRYGSKLVLVGNVDCSQLLPFGTRDEIRDAVKACLRAASPGGGHFISSSTQVLPPTPLENAIAFYEAVREFGDYPIRI